jgi:ornithine cyclodeaminase/alanine dehydrogenase-like protein (mu-crystallin family)
VKYMSKEKAEVVGMLGSGGMARTHMAAFLHARPSIRRLQVFSPTRENREAYAREMASTYGIEAEAVDHPSQVFRGADIVAGCTDSAIPLPMSDWLEPGTHVTSVGGRPDDATYQERIDVYLRLGTAPGPITRPEWQVPDEFVAWHAQPENAVFHQHKMSSNELRLRGLTARARQVSFDDLVTGRSPGRTSDKEITYSERGNLQGNQFWAVAGKVFEACRSQGLGRELPTDWFLQDIRD